MTQFETRGKEIRDLAKSLVLEFMHVTDECQPGEKGMKQAQIFKKCGFDWGDYPVATSSNQQYWLAAILWELQEEGNVKRVSKSGPWRLVCSHNNAIQPTS
jgi:hypothetical protein